MTEKPTRQPLRRELHRLLLWVTLPLVLLISALIYLDFVRASRNAEGFVQRRAATMAYEVSQFLTATQRGLELMAKRPGVLLMDPLRCDPGSGDLIAIQPRYSNVVVVDAQGLVICGASLPAPGKPPVNVAGQDWYQAVLAGKPFALSSVRRGAIRGRWIVSAAVPIRGANQAIVGVMVVGIDLVDWPFNAPASDPQADAVQGAIDRNGTILLRSPDAEKWVGRNSGNSQITADMLRVGKGTFVSKGVQDFDRFWAVQPIAGTPWIAYAGVRADAVRAQPLRQAALSAGVIVAILLAALWLALKASRRLTEPIAHLAQVAVRAGAGDLSVRAEPTGPAEVALVAQEVNRMLELRASAEADLRHQEQSLRITLNSIGDAVIATDAQGLVTRMNPAAEQLTGWPLADALGRPLAEVFRIVSALTRLPSANPVQRVMDSGEVVGLANHTALLARDGQEYQIADSAAPIRDAAGAIQGVVLVFSDVSERYRAEAALRVSEHALQAISQGVVISGSDQLIISANASFATITGYSVAQVLGRNCKFLQGPDTDPLTVAAIRTALHRSAGFAGEILNYRQDGTAFWNDLTITPVLDGQGALTHFIGIMRDINERKQAETALRASNQLYETAALATNDAIWDRDLTRNTTVWNAGYQTLFGYSPEVTEPNPRSWTDFIHPEDADRVLDGFQKMIDGGGRIWSDEYRFRRVDGSYADIFDRGYILRDEQGRATRIIGAMQDVTARKQAQGELQILLKEKTALLLEVHHRVKNNLQVITSLLRLEAGRSTVPEAVSVLEAMQGRIRSMAQLHEFLYRSGTFASVDLGVYLGQVATQGFNSQVLSANLLQLKLHMGSVQVGLDQAMVCGLLVNELVSNCLKHGFPDDRSGQVYVELHPADPATVQTDGLWRLCVRDTGAGLPADFEDRREHSLGMTLVGIWSQQAGGALEIQSQPGTGTEFSATFRALEPAALVMPL